MLLIFLHDLAVLSKEKYDHPSTCFNSNRHWIFIMGNLSIVVDEQILQKANQRATKQGLSLNTLLRGFLESYSQDTERYSLATTRLLELAKQSTAASNGQPWTREELYER
jgi:hypothetical protein